MTDYYDWADRERKEARENDESPPYSLLRELLDNDWVGSEPYPDERPAFDNLLRRIREALGPQA